MKCRSVAVSIALLISACADGTPPLSPTSPSAPPSPAAPRATHTMSGTVSEMTPAGQVPLEGVRVEEPSLRVRATTDKNGFYSMPGVYAGSRFVAAVLEGYQTETKNVTVDGDTQLDIQLVQRATYTLSGVVFEMTATGQQAPVEGVWVTESCLHAGMWTDSNGSYSFQGPFGTGCNNTVWASKEGYTPAQRGETINGDTQLDIQLVRR